MLVINNENKIRAKHAFAGREARVNAISTLVACTDSRVSTRRRGTGRVKKKSVNRTHMRCVFIREGEYVFKFRDRHDALFCVAFRKEKSFDADLSTNCIETSRKNKKQMTEKS